MKPRAWRLPWRDRWVPHALLDILRGCNLSCRACYNTTATYLKSLDEIRGDLQVLMEHRRLDSLGIVGGEPMLHPQLDEIIRMVKQQSLGVELFTNGVLLDVSRLTALKKAGADLIFLHIDAHQNRPDLPATTADALHDLRTSKASAVAAVGLEVGLSMTAYADALNDIDDAVQFVLSSPHVDYLLVTLCRDMTGIGPLKGDLYQSLHGKPCVHMERDLTIARFRDRLSEQFGLEPFAYLGSNRDADEPRWLSYMVGAITQTHASTTWRPLRPSGAEPALVGLLRMLRRRYPFYMPHSPGRFRVQLLANAMTGGSTRSNLRLIAQSLKPGRTLRTKRLLFQCPAEVAPDGAVIHCDQCPDATVRGGRIVPVCISDQLCS